MSWVGRGSADYRVVALESRVAALLMLASDAVSSSRTSAAASTGARDDDDCDRDEEARAPARRARGAHLRSSSSPSSPAPSTSGRRAESVDGFFSTEAAAGASATAGAAQGSSKSAAAAAAAASASSGAAQGNSKPAAVASGSDGGGDGGGRDGQSQQGDSGSLSEEELKNNTNSVKPAQSVGTAAIGGPFSLLNHDGKAKMAAAINKIKFHQDLIGLTGTSDEVRKVARAYRVYYMKTEEEGSDYLVDHSIVMCLMNPKMEFVKFFGKNYDEHPGRRHHQEIRAQELS
ncbi:hypothetical protein ZWY2020_056572 [Hordeum vulgare]|nr:hypothetical protein ZWY2020_056572 [Hordeum vulgare]